MREGRAKPDRAPGFPGAAVADRDREARSVVKRPPYPAVDEDAARRAELRAAALQWRGDWAARRNYFAYLARRGD